MLMAGGGEALAASAAVTGVALAGFGWLRARAKGLPPLRGAVQAVAIGGLAAFAAHLVARLAAG